MIFWKIYSVFYNFLNSFIPYQELVRNVHQHCRFKESGTYIDLGCGSGNLIKNRPHVVGMDISFAMLKLASKANPRVSLIQGDLDRRLPFRDHAFDGGCSSNVLAYLKNPETVLKELRRVLKPNAQFVLTTMKPDINPLRAVKDHLSKIHPIAILWHFPFIVLLLLLNLPIVLKLKMGGYRGFEAEELSRLFEASGFSVLHHEVVYAAQDILMVVQRNS